MRNFSDLSLIYKRFRIIAQDKIDRTYFVLFAKYNENDSEEFIWCRSNKKLSLGQELEGYLCTSESLQHPPTLIVGECNSIIPT
ncbi:hypothetical protein [Calothrix sp. PCC 6303]|uniref:hypothetical protein n=1 Tax=Calothrix sp. PCC 6303 TaxID=1170562 RepID=UPI0002A03F0B|nr:hypothetical protein [Calothrix sp. PCC 6303]AFZ02814.1 hypothetical protein Cal6303_3897 [Calothrix sp. PCC 6303]